LTRGSVAIKITTIEGAKEIGKASIKLLGQVIEKKPEECTAQKGIVSSSGYSLAPSSSSFRISESSLV